jgi:hypothetical protein
VNRVCRRCSNWRAISSRARRAALEDGSTPLRATVHCAAGPRYDRLTRVNWRDTQDLYRRREEEARVSGRWTRRLVSVEVVRSPA